jgi:hypothetical protein
MNAYTGGIRSTAGAKIMALLCLDLELERRADKGLHEHLRGDWALLFSHPNDFQPPNGLRARLGAHRVRLLTVRRDAGDVPPDWVASLEPVPGLVHLREPPFAAADAVSFGARRLRGDLLTMRAGFVLIVDELLKRRGIYRYVPGHSDVSVLDLMGSVEALRGGWAVGKAA